MLYVIISFFNGVLNIINKMVNVQAKKSLGMTSGTLINYAEATILTFLFILFSGRLSFVGTTAAAVPPLYYLGGVFGLIAMIFLILGTERCPVVLSTTLMLAGQLGMSVLLDALFFQRFSLLRLAGIGLIVLGSIYNQRFSRPEGDA